MEFLTFWKIPGMSRTLPAATDIWMMRSSTEVTGVSYSKLLMWPQKNKSIHDRSGDLAGQWIGSPRPIHRCLKMSSRCRRTSVVEEPRHAGTTCSGAMTEEHARSQVVQAELVAKKSGMPYRPNDCAESTAQWRSLQEYLPKQRQRNVLEPHVVV